MRLKIFNITTYINPSFWVTLGLFMIDGEGVYRSRILLIIAVGISVFIHELGHGLAAKYHKASPTITLYAFGGNTTYNKWAVTAQEDLLITLSGPALQAIMLLFAHMLLKLDILQNYYAIYFTILFQKLNVKWLIFNLLPIIPLDGGHIMSFLLRRTFKKNKQSHRVSILIALATVLLATPYLYLNQYYVWLIMLIILGFRNAQTWQNLP